MNEQADELRPGEQSVQAGGADDLVGMIEATIKRLERTHEQQVAPTVEPIFYTAVDFDGSRIVYATGSVALILTALREAVEYLGPRMVQSSYVTIELRSMGWRQLAPVVVR